MLSNKLFPPWTADGGKQGRERLASGSPRAQASVRGSPCACRARSWRQGWRKMQVNFTAHDPTADHWRFGVLLGGISRPLYAGWLALWTCLLKRIPSFFQKDSSGNASRVASSQPQKSRSASSETVALVVMEAPSAVRSLMSPWRLTRVFLRGASAPSLLRPSSSFRLVPSPLAFGRATKSTPVAAIGLHESGACAVRGWGTDHWRQRTPLGLAPCMSAAAAWLGASAPAMVAQ